MALALEWLFDVLLAAGLVWIAWGALTGVTLLKSVILFIAFGLFMALAWVRLDAVDIALAEAAIGAGLTGVLLLEAVGHVVGRPRPPQEVAGDEGSDGGRP